MALDYDGNEIPDRYFADISVCLDGKLNDGRETGEDQHDGVPKECGLTGQLPFTRCRRGSLP